VYQRLPDGAGDWTWGRDPSPGLPNTEAHHEGFLMLNELMSINATVIADAAGDHDPWLEIANPLPIPVELSGTLLRDAVGTEAELSGLIVPASGYQLLWLDGEPAEGPAHVASLLSAGGGALVFEATDGLATDSVIYPALGVDQAYARIPDGGDWEATDMVTPGQTNPATLEPLLVINEFLASNENGIQDETGAAEDWVELYNPGSEAVSLLGLSLTDDLTDPEQWYFPDMVLEPGSFLVVWCDDDPEDGPLHATFKLSAGGEEIGLFMGEELLDNVVFGAQTTDISYGRRVDAGLPWITFTNPTPGASNGSGVSAPLEEIPTPQLAVPHPNPFNPRTSVNFYVPAAGQVHLAVFDLRGRHVRTLVDGRLSAGRHALIWCGDDTAGRALPSGVYCLRMQCGGLVRNQRVTLAR
jgi:hypothetical protein